MVNVANVVPLQRPSDNEISRLAREISRGMLDLEEILKNFKLSTTQFEVILEDPFFQTRLNEETQLWNASDAFSIAKRIETKAATMVEDCLLEVHRLIHDPQQPMNAKVEALKWATRMAGVGENATKGSEGGGVKITINVGGKSLEFDKERKLPSGVTTDVIDLNPSAV